MGWKSGLPLILLYMYLIQMASSRFSKLLHQIEISIYYYYIIAFHLRLKSHIILIDLIEQYIMH